VNNFLGSAQVSANAEEIDYQRIDVGIGTDAVHYTLVETISVKIAHNRKSQIK